MATDDKDSKTPKPEGFDFVDRDDDLSSDHIDFDYEEDFPADPTIGGKDAPDPGYAAFAEDLEDPLADWPSPEANLIDLPEMQGEKDKTPASPELPGATDETSQSATRAPFDRTPFDDVDEPPVDLEDRVAPPAEDAGEEVLADEMMGIDQEPEAAFFDDPVDDPGDPELPETAIAKVDIQDDPIFDALQPEIVDRDEEPRSSAPQDIDTPLAEPLTEPLSEPLSEPLAGRSSDLSPNRAPEPLPEPSKERLQEPQQAPRQDSMDAPAGTTTDDLPGEDDEDDFVDDFLNDLDDLDEAYEERELEAAARADRASVAAIALETDWEDAPAASGGDSPAPSDEPSSIEAALASLAGPKDAAHDNDAPPVGTDSTAARDDMTIPDSPPNTRAMAEPTDPEEREASNLPWGMIAVVVVALGLLAAGGYGVVSQRSSLEAEIRELQAQLATAMPPEAAAADRERQRQIERVNETLSAEVEGLQAENTALSEQIKTLEKQIKERLAAETQALYKAAEAERAAQAAAEKAEAAVANSAAVAASTARSKSDGEWFVNFGSYAQRSAAQTWAAKLSVNEGEVVVQQATAAGKSLYRVRIVGLASRDRAERVATALERQHQLPRLWVGRN